MHTDPLNLHREIREPPSAAFGRNPNLLSPRRRERQEDRTARFLPFAILASSRETEFLGFQYLAFDASRNLRARTRFGQVAMRKRPGGQTAHLVAKRWRGYDGTRYGDNERTGIRDCGQSPPGLGKKSTVTACGACISTARAARDQLTPDSDIDIAVILDALPDRFAEHERTSELGAALSLEYDTVVLFFFAEEARSECRPFWHSPGDQRRRHRRMNEEVQRQFEP